MDLLGYMCSGTIVGFFVCVIILVRIARNDMRYVNRPASQLYGAQGYYNTQPGDDRSIDARKVDPYEGLAVRRQATEYQKEWHRQDFIDQIEKDLGLR